MNKLHRELTWQAQCDSTPKSNPTSILSCTKPWIETIFPPPTKSHSSVLLPKHDIKYMALVPKGVQEKEDI